jgi:hypothetical protein
MQRRERAIIGRGAGLLAVVWLLLMGAPAAQSQPPARLIKVAGVCMKSGERAAGMNKVCYYDCVTGEVARTIGSAQLCPLTIGDNRADPPQRPAPVQTTCFRKGEEVTGMTKQCAYDCLGSLRVQTIGSTQLCPLTIKQ